MNPLHEFAALFSNFGNIDPRMIVMWVVGGVLVYLAIKKEMKPTLLLPMGFGTILVNLPLSGAITQAGAEEGPYPYCLMQALPTSCSRCCCLSVSAP